VEPDLRVLTWNVRNHLGDPLALERVLRAARPDVACLQEVTRWPFSRYRLDRMARSSGLAFVCGGRASAGTALLASGRVVVLDARATRLPTQGWRTRPRGTASAVVRVPGSRPVRVASIHLGLDRAERARHVQGFADQLGDGAATVVAGDLNEKPGGPSWRALRCHLVDADPDGGSTFPAADPTSRIDAVLADPRLAVVAAGWPDGVAEADVLAASDHRPLLVTLRLPRP
jgi:endonuclease/exonuclease/phosphatase family metal-dependent hydrolase